MFVFSRSVFFCLFELELGLYILVLKNGENMLSFLCSSKVSTLGLYDEKTLVTLMNKDDKMGIRCTPHIFLCYFMRYLKCPNTNIIGFLTFSIYFSFPSKCPLT